MSRGVMIEDLLHSLLTAETRPVLLAFWANCATRSGVYSRFGGRYPGHIGARRNDCHKYGK